MIALAILAVLLFVFALSLGAAAKRGDRYRLE
jgi:hypothetical protein